MKKLLLIPTIVCIITLTGCSSKQQLGESLCVMNDDPTMESQIRAAADEIVKKTIAEKYRQKCQNKLGLEEKGDKEMVGSLIDQLKDIKPSSGTVSFQ